MWTYAHACLFVGTQSRVFCLCVLIQMRLGKRSRTFIQFSLLRGVVVVCQNRTEQNDRIWVELPLDHLPPLIGAKPGAAVLATLSDAQWFPSAILWWHHRYGTGKCLSITADRLWRLRFKTGDKYHWAWSQCIQFLTLSRLMGEHKRIRLETDRSL